MGDMGNDRRPGWQQPLPSPPKARPAKCPHLGLLFAALSVRARPAGHEWVCTCGAVFVVVSDGDRPGTKRLVQRATREEERDG